MDSTQARQVFSWRAASSTVLLYFYHVPIMWAGSFASLWLFIQKATFKRFSPYGNFASIANLIVGISTNKLMKAH